LLIIVVCLMSTSPTQPETSDTDDLVAYLDGELSADECRRVERRLSTDADYRRRLTELEQAWTALDALPPTVVDDDFARTTIEMVCVAAERDVKQETTAAATSAWRRKIWWLAGGAALALCAFAATWAFAPSRDRALVADLPVIAQLDVLTDVGDVEFLRGVAKFDIEPPARSATTDVSEVTAADWQTPESRREWIAALADGEKAELAAKMERFERELTPEARDRLRKLEQDIAAADDRAELEATLAAYGAWLQSRSPAERVELRERTLSTEKRLQRVERLVEQSRRSLRRQLSPDDEEALQQAIFTLVEERRHELVNEVRERGNPNAEKQIGKQRIADVALLIIGREMWDERRSEALETRLTAPLSDEAQNHLEKLDPRSRHRQLARWVYESLAVGNRGENQNLEGYFANDLTNDQREFLLGLPRAEMQQQLQQMYTRSQVGLREEGPPGWLFRGGPGGPGGRGPRGRGDDRDGRDRDGRDRRDGRRGDFDGPRFEGPPGRRGPGFDGPRGPMGPPPDGEWRPPPGDGRPPFGPPPPHGEGGRPPEPPSGPQGSDAPTNEEPS
jgi:hypothetical protein